MISAMRILRSDRAAGTTAAACAAVTSPAWTLSPARRQALAVVQPACSVILGSTRSFSLTASVSAQDGDKADGQEAKADDTEAKDDTEAEAKKEARASNTTASTKFAALERFRTPSTRNFVLPNQPFPMNRYFKPAPPLDDKTRRTIYDLFRKDEYFWTPRRLGEQFGLSIARVQAILRLKALEDKFKQEGKAVQTSLSEGMEKMLGSRSIEYNENSPAPKSEPLRYTFGGSMTPFIRLLDEEEGISPADAALMLRREPYNAFATKLDVQSDNVVSPPTETEKPKILHESERLTGSFRFMIVDTSSPKPKLLVRDPDGVLRSANSLERWERKHTKPRKFRM
ncbi:eukaryotic mitochondrial regulator protein-domain-containing protein [Entophlyctis helioformis]|nr:eukaryotic mitochondrial regulator protein-domain-containing protein [Entophlyctis helioformis]